MIKLKSSEKNNYFKKDSQKSISEGNKNTNKTIDN